MRIFAYILVIIVLVLNLVPCADAHDHADAPVTASLSSADQKKGHETPAQDACTPFCHCSCCANLVVLKIIVGLNPPFSIPQTSTAAHFEGRSTDVSLSVWQPPKLV